MAEAKGRRLWLGAHIAALALGALMLNPACAAASPPCAEAVALIKKGVELGDGSDREIERYRQAETLCPKMAEAHFNIGLALQKRGDLAQAEAELRQAIGLKDEENFRVGLGAVLLQKGEVSAARDQYDRVLERNSKNVAALQGLAVILEKQQKLQEAVDTLQRAATCDPSNATTQFNIGILKRSSSGTRKRWPPTSALAISIPSNPSRSTTSE